MLQKFIITSYAIIFTLAVVFIIPVDVEAADTPPASPIEKNNTGSWKTGPSSDLTATDVSGRCLSPPGPCPGDPVLKSNTVRPSKKVKPKKNSFPMSERNLSSSPHLMKKDGNKPHAQPLLRCPPDCRE
jgi:hypothetical protein